jgi:hypothetical protein
MTLGCSQLPEVDLGSSVIIVRFVTSKTLQYMFGNDISGIPRQSNEGKQPIRYRLGKFHVQVFWYYLPISPSGKVFVTLVSVGLGRSCHIH